MRMVRDEYEEVVPQTYTDPEEVAEGDIILYGTDKFQNGPILRGMVHEAYERDSDGKREFAVKSGAWIRVDEDEFAVIMERPPENLNDGDKA